MRRHKPSIILVLMLSLAMTIISPALAVQASPVTGILSQLSADSAGFSGNGLANILIGLLLGKLFGNIAPSSASADSPKTLGVSIVPVKSDTDGAAIVADARKYMGTPYVWGGVTPDGFDCSGFTQYVMKENGIDIPRTADDQFATGTPVSRADLQVGDLIFFTTYKPGASHVGFYLGNNRFLHASSVAKEVTIGSLDVPYYQAHYIGARRYTN
jgi:cell wall-associated NlpC family hydrolase